MENKLILISLEKEELTSIIKEAVQSQFSNEKKKELLSAKELCEYLGISSSTLSKWKAQNKIPYKRLGKRIFFKRDDVLEALKDSYYGKLKGWQYEN